MSDSNKKRYRKLYAADFEQAKDYLLPQYGGELVWVDHDYQAFQFRLPDVTLVFYPHKTSAHNHHLRVRDQNSSNKERAAAIMACMQFDKNEAGQFDCTFHRKNDWSGIWFGGRKDIQDHLRRIANGHGSSGREEGV